MGRGGGDLVLGGWRGGECMRDTLRDIWTSLSDNPLDCSLAWRCGLVMPIKAYGMITNQDGSCTSRTICQGQDLSR